MRCDQVKMISIEKVLSFLTINAFSIMLLVHSKSVEISSYAKVAKSGSNGGEFIANNTGNIHRSLQTDLWFPIVFNSTENLRNTSVPDEVATGRSANNGPRYPYFSNYPQFSRSNSNTSPKIVYPVYQRPYSRAELQKSQGKAPAMDRYTPGEAVATALYKQKAQGYVYKQPQDFSKSTEKTSIVDPPTKTYVPPKELYAFPPNNDASYLPPSKPESPKSSISSYLPPAAGPISGGTFLGPINPEYLPPDFMNKPMPSNGDDAKSNMPPVMMMMGMPPDSQDQMGPTDSKDDDKSMPDSSDMDDHSHHGHYHYPAPPSPPDDSGDDSSSPPKPDTDSTDSDSGPPSDHDHDHGPPSFDHDDHDHDHHHSFPPWANFYGSHGVDASSDIIYDHDPHHDHFHDHPMIVMMPTTTTTEPPPEPRVKKYSYFYLGRKLWYIPLYFTVWFGFYIAFLILKSIARHKVNLPNHYQKRSIFENMTHETAVDKVDNLTAFVMAQIDDFAQKYL